jgi:DNA-binding transcriptional MerR regulator
MGFYINQYQGFSGNAVDMAAVATQCAQFIQMPGDLDKINERLVRYYVTEGLVERPKRIGRDAEYGYLHLLQFLAGRFLVEVGFPMQKVAPYLGGLNETQLESLVMNKTKPNMAELLVASFQNGGRPSRREDSLSSPMPKVTAMQRIQSEAVDLQSIGARMIDPVQPSSASATDSIDKLQEQFGYLGDSIKAGLAEVANASHLQAKASQESMNKMQWELERMRKEMIEERERWCAQMDSERKEQIAVLEQQTQLNQELIKALIEAQSKGKQNG